MYDDQEPLSTERAPHTSRHPKQRRYGFMPAVKPYGVIGAAKYNFLLSSLRPVQHHYTVPYYGMINER